MIKVEGSLLACQNFARSRTIIPEQTLCFQHASFRNGAKGCLRRKHVYGYLSKQRSKKPLYKKTQFCTYLLAALLKGWHRYPQCCLQALLYPQMKTLSENCSINNIMFNKGVEDSAINQVILWHIGSPPPPYWKHQCLSERVLGQPMASAYHPR